MMHTVDVSLLGYRFDVARPLSHAASGIWVLVYVVMLNVYKSISKVSVSHCALTLELLAV